MGEATENIKQIAQIRKAVAPLVNLIKREADVNFENRLASIEVALEALLKRETTATPEVNVTVDTSQLEKIVSKLQKSEPKPTSTYEPHDQAKSSPYQYSGFIRSDGSWYIQRVAKGEQRYSKGTGDYTDAWERRGKLKYGYIDES